MYDPYDGLPRPSTATQRDRSSRTVTSQSGWLGSSAVRNEPSEPPVADHWIQGGRSRSSSNGTQTFVYPFQGNRIRATCYLGCAARPQAHIAIALQVSNRNIETSASSNAQLALAQFWGWKSRALRRAIFGDLRRAIFRNNRLGLLRSSSSPAGRLGGNPLFGERLEDFGSFVANHALTIRHGTN